MLSLSVWLYLLPSRTLHNAARNFQLAARPSLPKRCDNWQQSSTLYFELTSQFITLSKHQGKH